MPLLIQKGGDWMERIKELSNYKIKIVRESVCIIQVNNTNEANAAVAAFHYLENHPEVLKEVETSWDSCVENGKMMDDYGFYQEYDDLIEDVVIDYNEYKKMKCKRKKVK